MVNTSEHPREKYNRVRNTILGIIHFVFFIVALYLCFKCNNGFSLGPFLLAVIFPEIYVIFMIATNKGLCQT